MNKKILAFLMVMLLMMSAFGSFTASASDGASGDYSDSLAVINAINPHYTLPEESEYFTRIEFVKLLIDVMCPQTGQPKVTGYNDVDADSPYASSLVFAKDVGIVSPADAFNPDDNVTYTQAIKMAVSAAGYKPLADAKGAYPTGYLTLASELELTEGVASSGDAPLTIADGLKLICNLFDTTVFVQTGFGESPVYESKNGMTFLYQYHQIQTVYGIVNANQYSSLTNAADSLAKDKIKIGIADYKTNTDYSNLLGYNVKAYIKDADTVIYAEKHEVDEIILNASDIDRVDGFNVITYDGNNEKKYTLDDSFNYIKNGKASAITSANFTPYFNFDTGYVTLLDINSDNKFDTVKTLMYKYSLISKVSLYDNTIYDVNSAGSSIVLDDECIYSITSYDSGEAASITLKQLSEGMVIAYTESDDKMLYDITVCSDIIDGKITALDSTNNYVYINDVPYEPSAYYNNYYSYMGIASEGSFVTGIDGKLVAISATGENYMKYGWFVAFSTPSGLDELKLKIFSQTGEMQILTLQSNVLINNQSQSASYTKTFMEALDDTSRLVKYSANADGELKKLDTYTDALDNEFELNSKNPSNSLTKFSTGNYTFKSGINVFAAKSANVFSFHIESSTYNFIIPPVGSERDNDKNYAVTSSSYFGNDSTYSSMSSFDVNRSGCAGATLIFANKRVSRTLGDDEGTAVIEKITTGLNPEGENALVVYAWKGNKYDIYYSDPELTYDYINALNPGDLVRFITDENNVIISIVRDFNIATYEIASDRTAISGITEYIMGMSYGASDRYLNLLTNPTISNGIPKMPAVYGINNIRNINISNAPVVYVDLVRNSDGTIASALPRMSEITDIRSYLDSGDSASFVISRQRYLSPTLTIVYNIEVK